MSGAAVIQTLVGGLATGCIYSLAALGFVLIYKATEVINFAQGELMMVGAFAALALKELVGLPFWLAALLAVGAVAIAGAAINRLVLRPIIGEQPFAIVMATIGLGYLLRSAVALVPGWGTDTHALDTPFTGKIVRVGEIAIAQDNLMVIVAAVLTVSVLYVFFQFTRAGVAMQAVSQNQLAASFVGIRVRVMFSAAWALGAGIAALAGVLLAPLTFVYVNMGFIGLKALPAAVLGGFGSIPGALIGGLVIGVTEAYAARYLPDGVQDSVAYALLLIVLLVRPQGLFGVSLKKRV